MSKHPGAGRQGIAVLTSAALALSFGVEAAPAAAAKYYGPIGGFGGSKFTARCPTDEVLVGLAVAVNNALRKVAPICASALAPDQLNPDSIHTYEVVFGTVNAPGRYMRCPADRPVVRGVHLGGYQTRKLVQAVGLMCGTVSDIAPPLESDRTDVSWDAFDHGTFAKFGMGGKYKCGQGEVGVGVFGRSGASIDALGLICDAAVLKPRGVGDYAPSGVQNQPGQSMKPNATPGTGASTSPAAGIGTGAAAAGGVPAQPTPAPSGLTATVVQGSAVLLKWVVSPAPTVTIYRNGAIVTTKANDGTWIDQPGVRGTLVYRVCNAGTAACSADVTVTL